MAKLNDRDSLGILNENYFKRNYSDYLKKHKEVNLVMIDFKKFKAINDYYGHETGDLFLKTFANILSSSFKDSIAVRLHGDEYVVLTSMKEDEIEKAIKLCTFQIMVAKQNEDIPCEFSFNAGSAKAEHGIDDTKKKADFMMYEAKKNNDAYQRFDEEIWNKIQEVEAYKIYVKKLSTTRDMSYTKREFTSPNKKYRITQLCTKRSDGASLFGDGKYKLLKESRGIVSFDNMNIKNILEKIDFEDDKVLISIDYLSIIMNNNIIEYLRMIKSMFENNFSNIILSINLNGIKPEEYEQLSRNSKDLKKLGFSICFDQYDSFIGDALVIEEDICDYIKIDTAYWKKAEADELVYFSLRNKLQTLSNVKPPIMAIFGMVETEEEERYLTSLGSENIILGGNNFSQEVPIQFTKMM